MLDAVLSAPEMAKVKAAVTHEHALRRRGRPEEIAAVAVYAIDGEFWCSGSMLNNSAGDQTPYFSTANHCGVTSSNAGRVVVYWNYESPTCGALSGGLLALSAKHGRDRDKLDKGRCIANFTKARELSERFRQEFGGLTCRDLQQQFPALLIHPHGAVSGIAMHCSIQ
jgi:hypothetical protein